MFKLALERLSWAVAFTVVLAFFLPWLKAKDANRPNTARVHSEQAAHALAEDADRSWFESHFMMRPEEIREAARDPLNGTNGLSLLLLSRSNAAEDREKSRKLISFLGEMDQRQACVLIYGVPACVLIGACFMTAVPRGKWIFLIPITLSLLLYLLMRQQLDVTYFNRLVLDLSAGIGLWISLYGLLSSVLILILRMALGLHEFKKG